MNIMVTGHRPNGMPGRYGYTISNEAWTKLQQKFEEVIEQYAADKNEESITLITGMALGVDQVFWNAANELREEYPDVYKIEAAVPFKGQESKWFAASQREYRRMLDNSDEVTIVSPGCYSAAKMDIRNKYMVDKADLVIGVCCKNTGGTANCLKYAKSKHKDICVINPDTLDVQFFKG